MDANNNWFAIVRDLGIFGFVVWAIQKIINNSSDRKFADFKSQMDLMLMSYKNQYDRQIEDYKSQLKFLNDQLASLYSKRLGIIKELNDKLVKLHSSMLRLVSPRFVHPDPGIDMDNQAKIFSDAEEAYSDYNNYILFNAIYFSKELADKLEVIRKHYFEAHWDFFEPRRLESMGLTKGEAYRESGQKVINASNRIREEIPKAIEELESEFRYILGVDTKKDKEV